MAGGPKHNRRRQNNPKIRRVQRKAIKNNRPAPPSDLRIPSHKDGLSEKSNPKKVKLLRLVRSLAQGRSVDESIMDMDEPQATLAQSVPAVDDEMDVEADAPSGGKRRKGAK